MVKKIKKNDEDVEKEIIDEELIEPQDDETDEDSTDIIDEDIDIPDDEDIDIVIEIDEDDLDIISDGDKNVIEDINKDDIVDEVDDVILSKHKLEGKHSLKYDSIFKGKKEDPVEDEMMYFSDLYKKDVIEVDKSSNYYTESIDNERYVRSKLVKERVYDVLHKHTNINFLNNRRKPSRVDFNEYYDILKENLQNESFTNVELFNELAVYFSDNLFNMFKLLDKKWRNLIICELQDHIGKNHISKEIVSCNIYIGTEIEFIWEDEFSEHKIVITGDVIEIDEDGSNYRVNSYERIYDINICMITKILNNTKFKYNLNKLDNIDFL